MKKLKETWSKLKTWHKVVIVLIPLSIIANLFPTPKEAEKPIWSKMDSNQQSAWISNIRDNMESGYLSVDLKEAIEAQLKFPEEADINLMIAVTKPILIKQGEPVFMFKGDGITKNGFGVKVRFDWFAEVEIKPEGHKILSVIATEQ